MEVYYAELFQMYCLVMKAFQIDTRSYDQIHENGLAFKDISLDKSLTSDFSVATTSVPDQPDLVPPPQRCMKNRKEFYFVVNLNACLITKGPLN